MDNTQVPEANELHHTEPYRATVGVGDGSGQLFVHGSYEAVKVVQALILENERLRRAQPFNDLRPAQAERLALLVEEMGESLQAIGKVLRHGLDSRHPDGGPTNRKLLEKELGHVQHAVDRLCHIEDLSRLVIDKQAALRAERAEQYLHHN